jgi:hypothetical protein
VHRFYLLLIIVILLIACNSVTLPIQATITPSSSIPPVAATFQVLAQDTQVQFGPMNQTIDLNMKTFSGKVTGKSFTDFVAEMRCYNPYGQSGTDKWAYGYVFRFSAANGFYKIVVDSDANWGIAQGPGTETNRGKEQVLARGTVDNFNVKADEFNDLQLIVLGTDAVFIVNGQFVTTISELSQITEGDVAPALVGKEGTLGRCMNFTIKTFTNN